MTDIAENLRILKDEIRAQMLATGRRPEDLRLVAVSKTKPAADILAALQAGQIDFGENYAQEFREKTVALASHPLRWHFIGHLQSNKAKYVVGKALLIHTVDRLSLAQEIQKICTAKNITQDALIEVKLAAEATKSGCAPENVMALLKQLAELDGVRIKGLMTIATLTPEREKTRDEFRQLRLLRDEINAAKIYPVALTELSMGMSADYDLAIAEGATILRIGSRLFGQRG